MSGSSAGVPYSAQAIASSPSSPFRTTNAAWAIPSSTRHFLNARLPSYPVTWSSRSGWNLTHQHPGGSGLPDDLADIEADERGRSVGHVAQHVEGRLGCAGV